MSNTEVKPATEKQASTRLNVRITAFIKRANEVASAAHALLCDSLQHAETFGDARPLDRLITGMPSALRPVAARDWVKKYSPVTWNGDGVVGILKATSKLYKPFDVAGARLEPYWTPDENKAGKPLTLEMLIAMAHRIKKEVDKKAKSGEIGEGEDIDAMRLFAERIEKAASVQVVVDNTTLQTRQTIVENTQAIPEPTPVEEPAAVEAA